MEETTCQVGKPPHDDRKAPHDDKKAPYEDKLSIYMIVKQEKHPALPALPAPRCQCVWSGKSGKSGFIDLFSNIYTRARDNCIKIFGYFR